MFNKKIDLMKDNTHKYTNIFVPKPIFTPRIMNHSLQLESICNF